MGNCLITRKGGNEQTIYRMLANANKGLGVTGGDSTDDFKILGKPSIYIGGDFRNAITGGNVETSSSTNTLAIQFAKPRAIRGFIEKSYNASHFYATKIVLSYSDDNSKWVELLTKSYSNNTGTPVRVETTTPNGKHQYWKLVVTTYNNEHWQVSLCDFVE